MKTPMQEVYENFNLMSDADFKSWMLNTDLLDEEKEIIARAYIDGYEERNYPSTEFYPHKAEKYYNEKFNNK